MSYRKWSHDGHIMVDLHLKSMNAKNIVDLCKKYLVNHFQELIIEFRGDTDEIVTFLIEK